jgi:hypothetical protein
MGMITLRLNWASINNLSGVFGGVRKLDLGDSIIVTFRYSHETIYYNRQGWFWFGLKIVLIDVGNYLCLVD